jgi:hypothetical protein
VFFGCSCESTFDKKVLTSTCVAIDSLEFKASAPAKVSFSTTIMLNGEASHHTVF